MSEPASGFSAVGVFGLGHLVMFGVLMPWGAWKNRNRLATAELPRKKRYFATVILQQLLLTAISVVVAWKLGIGLFAPYRPALGGVVAAALVLATAVIALAPEWRRQAASGDRRVQLIAPIDPVDHVLWTAISAFAAIGEEITYRGVLYWVLFQLTGSIVASVAIAASVFGGSHMVQGWKAAVVVTGFAVAFHGLVIATGSLYPAMVVHFLYDLVAGVSYGRYARALARSNAFMNSTNATTLERGQAL